MTYFGVGPHDQLTEFVNNQDCKRKAERWAPEHSRDRCGVEDLLKSRPIQIDNSDQSGTNHPNGYDQVPPWSPERTRLQDRDSPVTDSKKVAILHENHGYVAIPGQDLVVEEKRVTY